MEISNNGLQLIADFEGFSAKPYICPAGVPTIGYGTTIYPGGRHVTMKDTPVSRERALYIMRSQIDHIYGSAVNRYVQGTINQNEFDALVSFTYNLGAGNLKSSTLLKRVNQGRYDAAAKEFLNWTRAGGKKLAGLVRRRKAEMKLFLA